ncbi:endolytic transglycosylase MltG [Kitasatospora sp. NBC_00374]|uniref:endolytic transglycosylase MltG n=1 Tax=Kitasatospora sp. NBC_00374 TaxID=2975964 RepID=UPI0030DF5AFF
MTDLGGGYGPKGDQPWYPGSPGAGGQQPQPGGQPGAWQQQNPQGDPYARQQGYPQQQGGGQAYGQQQGYPQQPQPQQGWPQQDGSYGQQQGYAQPQYGQPVYQQPQHGYQQQPQQQPQQPYQQQPQQVAQQRPMPQQAQQQRPVQPQPSGPGPDGIDWEAEAAALDAPHSEPAVEEWDEDEAVDLGYPQEETDEPDSFFGDGDQDNSRDAERKRKEKGKKAGRRNRGACLVVALVLLGGAVGAGWWGYGFYQNHFGPPPDYAGDGAGSVTVEIKPGSGTAMGQVLKEADVVKSTEAFVDAFTKNPKAGTIQPGFFTLHHQMSGEAAVKYLVDSAGGNVLVVPEGKKAVDIYTQIDTKLKLEKGTTANVAKAQVASLGLPPYAQGNLEGFLYPARYSIADGMKPEELLKQMVSTAVQHFQDLKLDEGAQKIGLKSGYEVLVEASILQAEGNNDADFGKIARVLSNRLNTTATQGKLQLDTTLQYKLGRTNFTIAEKDGDKSPYNTYVNKGLPPTPISNPGDDAIKAVLNPTPGDWVYFVALSAKETRFAVTFDDFKKDVKDYCTANNRGFDESAGMCK